MDLNSYVRNKSLLDIELVRNSASNFVKEANLNPSLGKVFTSRELKNVFESKTLERNKVNEKQPIYLSRNKN